MLHSCAAFKHSNNFPLALGVSGTKSWHLLPHLWAVARHLLCCNRTTWKGISKTLLPCNRCVEQHLDSTVTSRPAGSSPFGIHMLHTTTGKHKFGTLCPWADCPSAFCINLDATEAVMSLRFTNPCLGQNTETRWSHGTSDLGIQRPFLRIVSDHEPVGKIRTKLQLLYAPALRVIQRFFKTIGGLSHQKAKGTVYHV